MLDEIPEPKPNCPCPFCSSTAVIGVQMELPNGIGGAFAIECSRCRASGPKADYLAGAIERWNTRKVLQRKRG
jgi:Lar family restriction alleviation protein